MFQGVLKYLLKPEEKKDEEGFTLDEMPKPSIGKPKNKTKLLTEPTGAPSAPV
jgi:hypothetical protein